jgi:hypothetical protein
VTSPEKASYWDKYTMHTRIADTKRKVRHEAGSPNEEEVELYRKCLLAGLPSDKVSNKRIVVLGMTPEIRTMAVISDFHVISVDQSKDAIDMYKTWIPERLRQNEEIIHTSWWKIHKYIDIPVDAVIGDGVFGNVLSVEKHIELLRLLKSIVNKDGILVFRKALLPDQLDMKTYEAHHLIEKYRSGKMSGPEFGFAMRLWGNYLNSYHPDTFLLDNRKSFMLYKSWVEEGLLSEKEYACINNYYFDGLNMIMSQSKWEELLESENLSFKQHQLKGKDWYSYYSIYSCRM